MFNANTAVSTEQERVSTWCEQVRSIRADYARPIHPDDPRFTELCNTGRAQWTPASLACLDPDTLGELYFTHASNLPAFPLPAPAWAVRTEIRVGTYPEIVIEHYGQEWTSGDFAARIVQSDAVFVEDSDGYRESEHAIGTPAIDATDVTAFYTLEEATRMSTVLNDAAHEFTSKIGEATE